MHTNTNTVVNLCVDVFNTQEYTGCGKKSGPLQFFAVFSATVKNFNLKFYKFI